MQNLPTKEFSFSKMRDLFTTGQLQDNLDCKNYLSQYFIPTSAGTYAFVQFTILQKETMNDNMLDYIKLLWADNNENMYEYLLKWFANMIKGIKNSSCLYAKGAEGIGKSTLTNFVRDHVIGKSAYCKGKADHLKGQHNMQLLGKISVVFEEL